MTEHTYQILVADDDDAFRRALCEIFSPFFRLIEASSGEEAMDLAAREEVHLALFDMHMDRLTGLEAFKQLKTLHVIAPCILMTADYTEALREDAEQAEVFTCCASRLPGATSSTPSPALSSPSITTKN